MATLTSKPKTTRIECIGPGCRTVVSMNTAKTEQWIVYQKDARLPHNLARRDLLGWCRACKERYGVSE